MSTETNHFSPDMPSGDWQQYRCTACNLPRRVPIKPSIAPMTLYRTCKRCESRQRLRSDGGAGSISMIDLTTNPNISRAELLGKLRSAHAVRTPIREGGEESPRIVLTGDDTGCSVCGSLIGPDAFGEGAPYYNILAQQLRQRGETHCPDCLTTLSE